MHKLQNKPPISRSSAFKFLVARKFDVAKAVLLHEQHEETRLREGLFGFNCAVEPLKSEIRTQKFTILVMINCSVKRSLYVCILNNEFKLMCLLFIANKRFNRCCYSCFYSTLSCATIFFSSNYFAGTLNIHDTYVL